MLVKIAPRIAIPVALALLIATLVGGLFLWQIHSSVDAIENAFHMRIGINRNSATSSMSEGQDDALSQSEALLLLRQGEIFERRGQWQQAEERYQKSVESGAGAPAIRKLVSLQLQRREYDKARESLAKLKKEDESSPDVVLFSGILDLESGKIDSALRTFNKQPELPQSQYGLGLTAIAQLRHDDAKEAFAKAAQGNDPAVRALANVLLGAYNEFALFPEGQDIHVKTLIARALAEVNRCELALPLVTGVTATQGKYRDAWIVKGYCEFTTERSREALTSLEQAYAIDPQKPEVQYFLARTYESLGDPQNAVTFLQYAIQNGFEPEKDARELLVDYALELGNIGLALEQEKLLSEADDASLATVAKYIDLALSVPERAGEAYEAAKTAVKKWPNDAAAQTLLGRTLAAMGKPDDAERQFNEALRLDPKYGVARQELEKLKK